MSAAAAPSAGAPPVGGKSFFGHPRGLATIFMTEMWERFSFYGMRAILVLYLTAPTSDGGLGLGVGEAAGIYGLYNAGVYMFALPGGWYADRLSGQRRAVLIGGVIIAIGHFAMVPSAAVFVYTGLVLITIGTGLLKPNMASIVGGLYSADDPRRDSGFSIYYMGINVGALLAPLIVGYLGQDVGWHVGFAAAGVGMVAGLIQYVLGQKYLGDVCNAPAQPATAPQRRRFRELAAAIVLVVGGLIAIEAITKALSAADIESLLEFAIVLVPIAWFGRGLTRKTLSPTARRHLWALLILFIASVFFWLVYDQAGSTLSVFAQDKTNLDLFGFHFPSSWFQSVNPVFILALAPPIAWLWVHLGKRQPSTPIKFSIGLVLVGVSFLIMMAAASAAGAQGKVTPWWLISVYFVQTIGELTLSPVGLSAATRLAPAATVGTTMGVWYLSISAGDAIGGHVAGLYEQWPLPLYFGVFGAITIGVGIVMVAVSRVTKRLMDE